MNISEITLRCEDHAETVEFLKFTYDDDNDVDYEINIVDSYCGYDFMGIKNRFKRAWHAFWAKPICYTGIFVKDETRMKTFLENCLKLMNSNNQ